VKVTFKFTQGSVGHWIPLNSNIDLGVSCRQVTVRALDYFDPVTEPTRNLVDRDPVGRPI
jgi:hypothetical protein